MYSIIAPLVLLFISIDLSFCIVHDFKGFDDSILFGLNWPGSTESLLDDIKEKEVMKVITSKKENYECYLPEVVDSETTSSDSYDGPSPFQLLEPLFALKICSYRLESYWSYELCHGRYIRQYHEEREGKEVKSQEYFLGYWNTDKDKEVEASITASTENQRNLKYTKIDGLSLPYIELTMKDGTQCDLNGKARQTKVLYVCYSHGKHELYSFKEISTCEYEIVVLSPLLCAHPHFKPKETSENIINCIPIGDAPKKPRNLLSMEAESLKFNHQSVRLSESDNSQAKDVFAVFKVEKIEKDGETHLKVELRPLNGDTATGAQDPAKTPVNQLESSPPPVISDDSPVRSFLMGDNCLSGGSGWWKYEFCYGKYVEQFHIDRTGLRTKVLLGTFDEQVHLDWIRDNPSKAPKPVDQRTSISHYYSNGDICDKTDKPRQTEVKLKCLENSSSPAQVSLYLLEPKTCHYILGVESPLICDILPLADENGLVKSIQLFSTKPSVDTSSNTKNDLDDTIKHENE